MGKRTVSPDQQIANTLDWVANLHVELEDAGLPMRTLDRWLIARDLLARLREQRQAGALLPLEVDDDDDY